MDLETRFIFGWFTSIATIVAISFAAGAWFGGRRLRIWSSRAPPERARSAGL